MEWTNERPTRPGFYWMRNTVYRPGETTIVEICDWGNLTASFLGTDWDCEIRDEPFDYAQWLGPLAVPE